MFGFIAVKYKREPIMLRYSFWSTGSEDHAWFEDRWMVAS
jgi:hypothetical protein